jgi:ribosomal protein S27E
MPKRKCLFTDALQKEFTFLKKAASDFEVICRHCGVKFSVAHGGRSDINDHVQSGKHKKCVAAKSSKGT